MDKNMDKSVLYATHRKCLGCRRVTSDLNQETCECGRYMHLISQMYSPKVEAKKKG